MCKNIFENIIKSTKIKNLIINRKIDSFDVMASMLYVVKESAEVAKQLAAHPSPSAPVLAVWKTPVKAASCTANKANKANSLTAATDSGSQHTVYFEFECDEQNIPTRYSDFSPTVCYKNGSLWSTNQVLHKHFTHKK